MSKFIDSLNPFNSENRVARTATAVGLFTAATLGLAGCASGQSEEMFPVDHRIVDVGTAKSSNKGTSFDATQEAVCDAAQELAGVYKLPTDVIGKQCVEATLQLIEEDNTGVPHNVTGETIEVKVSRNTDYTQFAVDATQLPREN